jgi:Ca2+/Na+ antiporter
MLLSVFAIIVLVEYGLVPGIDRLSAAAGWSLKARGKATGYATSVPELVTLVAAGLSGVWDAGLWNIASSNLINFMFAGLAVLVHKRGAILFHRRFLAESSFAALGVAIPLMLMGLGLDTHVGLIPILFGVFVLYLMMDKGDGEQPQGQSQAQAGSRVAGVLFIAVSLALIMVAGLFLGEAINAVVKQLGVPAMAAGWILGFATSLPEAVTFFAVFSAKRKTGRGGKVAQVQELLDNLSASNMSNSALIYPIGLGLYLLGSN